MPIKFTKKHKDFLALALKPTTRLITLEGTVRSSKTVIAIQAFFYKVWSSDAQLHLIAGRDFDTINNNMLKNDMGLLSQFPNHCRLKKDKIGGYYVELISPKGIKKILIVGFLNRSKWTKILGLSLENMLVDEVNVADEQFVKECFSRQVSFENPLTLWTLNGDNPDHYIYTDYINRANILGYAPPSTVEEMNKAEKVKGWYYTFWHFTDNPVMTDTKIQEAMRIYPVGSHYYIIKILGQRGIAEGTIFAQYLNDTFFAKNTEVVFRGKKQIMNEIDYNIKSNQYIRYSVGVDLGNNELKRGTILTFTGIRLRYKQPDVIDTYQAKSTESNDLVIEICNKIAQWYYLIPDKSRFDGVYIDGYGSVQILIPTIRKKLWSMGLKINVDLCIKFGTDGGREARMTLLLLLINQGKFLVNDNQGCKELYKNLRKIVYDEKDGLPFDENKIENDYYDSLCYSITPFTKRLNEEVLGGAMDKCLVG